MRVALLSFDHSRAVLTANGFSEHLRWFHEPQTFQHVALRAFQEGKMAQNNKFARIFAWAAAKIGRAARISANRGYHPVRRSEARLKFHHLELCLAAGQQRHKKKHQEHDKQDFRD